MNSIRDKVSAGRWQLAGSLLLDGAPFFCHFSRGRATIMLSYKCFCCCCFHEEACVNNAVSTLNIRSGATVHFWISFMEFLRVRPEQRCPIHWSLACRYPEISPTSGLEWEWDFCFVWLLWMRVFSGRLFVAMIRHAWRVFVERKSLACRAMRGMFI